jgi:DNA-binding response OmpR family regulator
MKLLIIEDEDELLNSVKSFLKSEGYLCESASNYEEGSEKINLYDYDCIVADIGLPDGSGLDLIQELKSKVSETGVIIISARNSLDDRINGLDIGADDYLTKPFHLSELNARIKSVLRRRKFQGNKIVAFNEIQVHTDSLRVEIHGKTLALTRKEFDLLLYLISNSRKILTKESIVEHLWGDYINAVDSYDFIYTHISNLRKKLIENGANDYVKTVYGLGYKFSDE